MKKTFAENWKKELECREMYRKAEKQGDEAGMDAARMAHQELKQEIGAEGGAYCRIYRLYTEAQVRGNEYIDFNDVIWDYEVEELTACLKKYGIEAVTFSSTWSSSIKIAWLFVQNGFKLEGLKEINGHCRDFINGGYEKVPAYVFRIG